MFFRKLNIVKVLVLFLVSIVVPYEYFTENESEKTATETDNRVDFDLDKISDRGKLIALTDYNSTNYFIYKGEPMGFHYELLKKFARHMELDLEIILVKDYDNIYDKLNTGKGDILASNFTVTNERLKLYDFSEPILHTKQVLVQRKPENWRIMKGHEIENKMIRNTIELTGKKIYVRKKTSFYERLVNLEEEIGADIDIVEVPSTTDNVSLIEMVENGEIPFTIADENMAKVAKTYCNNIDIKTSISFTQKIAWATRKDSPQLITAISHWVKEYKTTKSYKILYNKYFVSRKELIERTQSEFHSMNAGKISVYDGLVKIYSEKIGWDWRLLSSLICQESNFNPTVKSWAGAYGLMQLMPTTAQRFGADSVASPEESIIAGTKYLKWLDGYWSDRIPEKEQRLKFVLASYNVGLGHVLDAQKLAKKYGNDPEIWDNNVDFFLLNKSKELYYNDSVVRHGYCRGSETYKYVKEVVNRFEQYKNLIEV